jgi:hypothetical protein
LENFNPYPRKKAQKPLGSERIGAERVGRIRRVLATPIVNHINQEVNNLQERTFIFFDKSEYKKELLYYKYNFVIVYLEGKNRKRTKMIRYISKLKYGKQPKVPLTRYKADTHACANLYYYLNLLKFCCKKSFPVLLLKRVLMQDKLRQEATDLSLVISNNKINYFQE